MSEKIYDVSADWSKRAFIDDAKYREMYARSVTDPNGFWAEQGKRIDWIKPFTKVENISFAPGNISIKWFEDGVLNVAWNCIDRHLDKRGDQTAIIWEGDDPSQSKHITYRELHDEVCKMANILRTRNVKKGDRVTIYLPMIPEAAYAMLACARIGAIHSVVFAGFSPDSLAQRITDCQSKIVITADEGLRGGRKVPLKANVDAAIEKAGGVDWVVVVKRTGGAVDMNPTRDLWYHDAAKMVTTECPCEPMHAEDPLFILYTSGSTGQPKGVLHTIGRLSGVRVDDASIRVRLSRRRHLLVHRRRRLGHRPQLHPLWTAGERRDHADVRGRAELSGQFAVLERGRQAQGQHLLHRADRDPRADAGRRRAGEEDLAQASLRLLGSVGEPINPEAWEWYHRVVGDERCPIVDTWWQTETGGILITPLPGATKLKPGSATRPFFGVVPEIVDADGKVLDGETSGNLCIAKSWPGQMRTVYGDHARFEQTYFSTYKGKYFTGDGCRRDADGYYWITGRVDDVINVSGHRMGTAEVESSLVAHEAVSEAAVVGYPHDIKGQGIYAYVTLMTGKEPTEALRKELVAWVRKDIGPIASPDLIQFAPGLPKTRSGKIMRRILRKIAEDEPSSLGDTSTLADPAVVDDLVQNRQNKKGARRKPALDLRQQKQKAPDRSGAFFLVVIPWRAQRTTVGSAAA